VKLASLCCGLLLLYGGARAQDAKTDTALPPAPQDFVAFFQAYCLEKFPDDSALASAASDGKFAALTPSETKLFLRGDPGQGWLIQGESGKYILTDEMPPYHACAVRHAVRTPFSVTPLKELADKYVTAKGHRLVDGPAIQTPMGEGIVSALSSQNEVDEKGVPTGEAFMLAVVSYPAQTLADGTRSQPFWEIRFVRQILRTAA
jgi:hypothetical protein